MKGAIQTLFATHPPMEKRIERAAAARGAAAGAASPLVVGFLDAILGGQQEAQGRCAPDRLFAMTTAYVTMQTGLGHEEHAARPAIVFQPLATADFEQILKDAEELLAAPRRRPARSSSPPTTSSATAGSSCATPTSRTSSSRSTRLHRAAGRRLRRPPAGRRVRVRGRRQARLLHLQLQARRPSTRSCRRRRASSATPSASCA